MKQDALYGKNLVDTYAHDEIVTGSAVEADKRRVLLQQRRVPQAVQPFPKPTPRQIQSLPAIGNGNKTPQRTAGEPTTPPTPPPISAPPTTRKAPPPPHTEGRQVRYARKHRRRHRLQHNNQ